jgi:uncharacterized membrane protein
MTFKTNMIMNITFMKGAICMLILFAYLIGTSAVIGYSMYIGEWMAVVCVLVMAAAAFPTVRRVWDEWRKL